MKTAITVLFATVSIALITACGGGSNNESGTIPGGICLSSGSVFICQGRVCTKSILENFNGVICPGGQYCPIVNANAICAARST